MNEHISFLRNVVDQALDELGEEENMTFDLSSNDKSSKSSAKEDLSTEKYQLPDRKNRITMNSKEKPKRPCSAYNIFFRYERQILISGESPEYSLPKICHLHQAAIQNQQLQRKEKRRHRRTHGKISFVDLTKTIARRWSELDGETRALFEQVSTLDKLRYKTDIEEWKKWHTNAKENKTTTTTNNIISELPLKRKINTTTPQDFAPNARHQPFVLKAPTAPTPNASQTYDCYNKRQCIHSINSDNSVECAEQSYHMPYIYPRSDVDEYELKHSWSGDEDSTQSKQYQYQSKSEQYSPVFDEKIIVGSTNSAESLEEEFCLISSIASSDANFNYDDLFSDELACFMEVFELE